MLNVDKIQEISSKIKKIVMESPVSELDDNLHALIQGMLTNLGLVSREEMDTQSRVLQQTQAQLQALEIKIATLEAMINKK